MMQNGEGGEGHCRQLDEGFRFVEGEAEKSVNGGGVVWICSRAGRKVFQ